MTKARTRGILFLLIAALALPAMAATSERGESVGTMRVSAAAVEWEPIANSEKLILTVSGSNGVAFTREFAGGSHPSFRIQDLARTRVDGVYQYELRAVPRVSAEIRQRLTAAREAGDDAAALRIQVEAGLDRPAVQSGAFTISNGSFVGDAQEPGSTPKTSASPASAASAARTLKPAPLDIVFADDVIVQGSLCAGLDCVNNESFGFDTIRLKENNTRIKFDDTSTASGFPNHDWQLTANDSASGGANKFSIEDITAATVPVTVTGSAPTNSIFVDSTGRVGFRTSTPVLDLHVNTSNTPALRLEQNSSGGFSAQTWDVAGNEANFFVRDVTGGSRLPFRIRPGAPTSSIDINASGNVGVGTASPSNRMHVFTTTSADGLSIDGTTFPAIVLRSNGTIKGYAPAIVTAAAGFFSNSAAGDFAFRSEANKILFGVGSGASTLAISGGNVGIGTASPGSQLVLVAGASSSSINAGSAQFTVASSRTLKDNIAPVAAPDILKKIEAVPVVTYDFKDNGPKDRMGLVAEDFHQVFGRGDDKHIDGQEVQMALWLAVQKLTEQNKQLTDRLATLEKELASQQKTQN